MTNMVANKDQCATESARLRDRAAECRLTVIESQLALGFTLCALAETEIRYGRPGEALKLVNKLWHHAQTIRTHLDEPDHLPGTAISDIRQQLTKLTERTAEIESNLRRR